MFVELDAVGEDYAAVVIGGGAVGLTLAVAMADRGQRVLLLEAGPRSTSTPGAELFGSVVDGRPFRGVTEGRARVLGGTTTRWGGQFLPLPPSVLAARPWLDAPAWPVSAEELEPYYEASAQTFGLPAARPAPPWSAGDPGAPALGDLRLEFSQWTRTPNFAARFADRLAEDPLIHVVTEVPVVDLHSTGGTVDGFTVTTAAGPVDRTVRAPYVLAAGTIESTRLLVDAPGLAFAVEPEARHHVGVGFHDHVALVAARVEVRDRRRFHRLFDGFVVDRVKVTAKLALEPEVGASEHLVEVGGFFAMGDGGDGPRALRAALQHLRRGHGLRAVLGEARIAARHVPAVLRLGWHYLVHRRIAGDRHDDVFLHLHAEQEPSPESCLSTGRSATDGTQVAVVRWRVNDASRRAMVRLASEIDEVLRANHLGHLTISDALADPEAFQAAISDSLHHMGGLALSADSQQGVCNGDAMVRGTDNLYVAGAALFPTGGYSNPTHTALALALRLGDHLVGLPGCSSS